MTSIRCEKIQLVEQKLVKAKVRLVECDTDMLTLVQEQLRKLQDQRYRLQVDLEAVAIPGSRRIADCDQMVEKALEHVTRLSDVFRNGNSETVRKFLENEDAMLREHAHWALDQMDAAPDEPNGP